MQHNSKDAIFSRIKFIDSIFILCLNKRRTVSECARINFYNQSSVMRTMMTTTTTGNDNKEEIQLIRVTENVSCVQAVNRCTYRMTRAESTTRNTYYNYICI